MVMVTMMVAMIKVTRSLSLPYVADDSLLCKLGTGVCPGLKHLDVQVIMKMLMPLAMMIMLVIIW